MKRYILAAAALACGTSAQAAIIEYNYSGILEGSFVAAPRLGIAPNTPISFSAKLFADTESFASAGTVHYLTKVWGAATLAGKTYKTTTGQVLIQYAYANPQDETSWYPSFTYNDLNFRFEDGSEWGLNLGIFGITPNTDIVAPQSASDLQTARFSAALSASDGVTQDSFTSYSLGDVRLTAIGLAQAPAVPEPATWAMLIVGLGAVGIMLRRRTTHTASTAIA
jgi:hypothetical protein